APGRCPPRLRSFGNGRYQLLRLLSDRPSRRMLLVRDLRLDRQVAYLEVKAEQLDPAGRARMRREAQALGRLGNVGLSQDGIAELGGFGLSLTLDRTWLTLAGWGAGRYAAVHGARAGSRRCGCKLRSPPCLPSELDLHTVTRLDAS